MIAKSLLVCGAMACAMGPVAAGQEDAHGYPQKVVKVVVPTGPGGPTDILARIIADRLQTTLKKSVIIENIPAGGGIVAASSVARATSRRSHAAFRQYVDFFHHPRNREEPRLRSAPTLCPGCEGCRHFSGTSGPARVSGKIRPRLDRQCQSRTGPAQLRCGLRNNAPPCRRAAQIERQNSTLSMSRTRPSPKRSPEFWASR